MNKQLWSRLKAASKAEEIKPKKLRKKRPLIPRIIPRESSAKYPKWWTNGEEANPLALEWSEGTWNQDRTRIDEEIQQKGWRTKCGLPESIPLLESIPHSESIPPSGIDSTLCWSSKSEFLTWTTCFQPDLDPWDLVSPANDLITLGCYF